MVLTRSMMKAQGMEPIITEYVSKPKVTYKSVEKPALAEVKEPSWPYYALFIAGFAFCVYQKSAIGVVSVSLLSQIVHKLVYKS